MTELSEVKKARYEAEAKILQTILDAMEEFTARTGLCFKSVNVVIQNVTTYGDTNKMYLPTSVYCEVEYD